MKRRDQSGCEKDTDAPGMPDVRGWSWAGVLRALVFVLGFGALAPPADASQLVFGDRYFAVSAMVGEASRAEDADDRAALLAQALDMALAIEEAFDRAWALSDIGIAQVEFGDIDGARSTAMLFDDARRRGAVMLDITRYHIAKSEFEIARRTADDIELQAIHDMAMFAIVTASAAAGDFAMATELIDGFDDRARQLRALTAVAITRADSGDQEAAQRLFDKALGIARGFEDFETRGRRLASVGVAQNEAGDLGAARRTLAEARDQVKPFVVTSDEIVIQYGSNASESTQGMLFTQDPLTGLMTFVGEPISVLLYIGLAQASIGDLDGAGMSAELITNDAERERLVKAIAKARSASE